MTELIKSIIIAITDADRQQAYQFAQQQPTEERSQQVYRNTLGVLVTQHCLARLGIETDLAASHSWNPLERQIENIADLYIPSINGYLECRVLRRSDRKCHIPPEVWTERWAYVIIQLDEPYQEGEILGFVESVSVAELPLTYVQPLEILLERLTLEPLPKPIVQLNQWLKRTFESDWQPPKDLLNIMPESVLRFRKAQPQRSDSSPADHSHSINLLAAALTDDHPQAALVKLIESTQDDEIRWQAAESLWELNPQHPACPIISAKDLGIYLLGYSVVLMVGILPKSDGRLLILLRVYPLDKSSTLPPGLQLVGFDDSGDVFFSVESRQQDHCIQFKFTADGGDRFSVRVILDEASFTEDFLV